MKSNATRLEELASWERLRRAWRVYRGGKRRRPEVAWFEIDGDRRLLHLSREILGGHYRHGAYRLLRIRDPKARLIAVAPVRDRIVHTAIYQGLAPWFNRSLIDHTYACLEGWSTPINAMCVNNLKKDAYTQWFVRFFEAVRPISDDCYVKNLLHRGPLFLHSWGHL